MPAHEILSDEEDGNGNKQKVKIFSMAGEFLLKFMERMMHRSKLWSLKFHNVSNVWFQRIREKRQRSERIAKEALEKDVQNGNGMEQDNSNVVGSKDNLLLQDKGPRPMVSAGATMPQKKAVMEKNKLEEALIRRIAINPRDIEAYERLGDYYMESENSRDALECFKQVLRLSPTHHKARLRIRRLERMK
ncbi:MAG: hypothetical protein ACD_8C00061G0004 [uncultured bacterium]|nr:MAG: hypothetical protein ACD_8C00061G0004 [uncultured bacterium]